MANAIYQHGVKHFARGDQKWILDASPTSGEDTLWKTYLVDTADYTFSQTHEFRDAAGLAAGIEETSGAMTLVDARARAFSSTATRDRRQPPTSTSGGTRPQASPSPSAVT